MVFFVFVLVYSLAKQGLLGDFYPAVCCQVDFLCSWLSSKVELTLVRKNLDYGCVLYSGDAKNKKVLLFFMLRSPQCSYHLFCYIAVQIY